LGWKEPFHNSYERYNLTEDAKKITGRQLPIAYPVFSVVKYWPIDYTE
jgi:hypothetical protein